VGVVSRRWGGLAAVAVAVATGVVASRPWRCDHRGGGGLAAVAVPVAAVAVVTVAAVAM
jgi:hypothetical protein